MEKDHKKIAAAISAVNHYLEEERTGQKETREAPLPFTSLWALSGRQEIMNSRALVVSGFFKH